MRYQIVYLLFLIFSSLVLHGISVTRFVTNAAGSFSSPPGLAPQATKLQGPAGVWGDSNDNLYIADGGYCQIFRVDAATSTMAPVIGKTFFCTSNGVNIPATSATITAPSYLYGDTQGNLYFSEGNAHTVKKIEASTSMLRLVAGNGTNIFADHVHANSTGLNQPGGVWVDSVGYIYIADAMNHRVRLIDPVTHIITTIAGTGIASSSGDGFSASLAELNTPRDVQGDNVGSIYIVETASGNVRVIDQSSGVIVSVMVGLNYPFGVWVMEYTAYYYVAETNAVRILYAAMSLPSTTAAGGGSYGNAPPDGGNLLATDATLNAPLDLYVNTNLDMYIIDSGWGQVDKVDGFSQRISRFSGGNTAAYDEGRAATLASVKSPVDVWGNTLGELFYLDTMANLLRKITIQGDLIIYTGTGLPSATSFYGNSIGILYVADASYGTVKQINTTNGNQQEILPTSLSNNCVQDNVPGMSTCIWSPGGLWVSTTGDVFLTDVALNNVKRWWSHNATITRFAGDESGCSFSGDYSPARSAFLCSPSDVWGDTLGNVFILDSSNFALRRVSPGGIIVTIAGRGTFVTTTTPILGINGQMISPQGLTGDSIGNLYVTDSNVVRMIYPDNGDYYMMTVAGDSSNSLSTAVVLDVATSFPFAFLYGIWADTNGIVYFADSGGLSYIRKMFLAGDPTGQPSSRPSGQPSSQPSRQPTRQPTSQPSAQPTTQPISRPTSQPSRQPSSQPTSQPSRAPTAQPSRRPSAQPSNRPTSQPSRQPSSQPTGRPTTQPSSIPSSQPSAQPSGQPSRRPTSQPSCQPTTQPSRVPTSQPTNQPSARPSAQPSRKPSAQPSNRPTSQPSRQPSSQPTGRPTAQPSSIPSSQPSAQPSGQPSRRPTSQPSCQPSSRPTSQPSRQPSSQPSQAPSSQPSTHPSCQPSRRPTAQPSIQPTARPSTQPSRAPTSQPSSQPSVQPSRSPSGQPTNRPTSQPSSQPTRKPSSQPSCQPSSEPTCTPTGQPSSTPSTQPSSRPTRKPTSQPSSLPSSQPTAHPSRQPTNRPSAQPSSQPTRSPSSQPSTQPSSLPSSQPSAHPSQQPSAQPTQGPTARPTGSPTSQPTNGPSCRPSCQPTVQPSAIPSSQPSNGPSAHPTREPSGQPSSLPTSQPSSLPSIMPTGQPSTLPTGEPSSQPSSQPTAFPSSFPSNKPSVLPSSEPSGCPSAQPSSDPSTQPTTLPSAYPTAFPSGRPSGQPTLAPSAWPSSVPSTLPSCQPSALPSSCPTSQPSSTPSVQPTSLPSALPSTRPSQVPSASPSVLPSSQPSARPSSQPTSVPSTRPTCCPSLSPITRPTSTPSGQPTRNSLQPSPVLSLAPSQIPGTPSASSPSCAPSTISGTQSPTAPAVSSCPSRSVSPTIVLTNSPAAPSTPMPSPTVASSAPSVSATSNPSCAPSTVSGTQLPSAPSISGSPSSSANPTTLSAFSPSVSPTSAHCPTISPAVGRSPSAMPTRAPSSLAPSSPSPSASPTRSPTTILPSPLPTTAPTSAPTKAPTFSVFPLTASFEAKIFMLGSAPDTTQLLSSIDLTTFTGIGQSFLIFGQQSTRPTSFRISDQQRRSIALPTGGDLAQSGGIGATPTMLCISELGDVTGDGIADLAVGYPLFPLAEVFMGVRNQPAFANMSLAFTLVADDSASGLGYAVTAAGDWNRDDLDDFFVSAPYANRVYLIVGFPLPSNLSAPLSFDVSTVPLGTTIIGDDAKGYGLGLAMSLAGDMNGDGLTDLAISSLDFASRTVVFVLFGWTDRRDVVSLPAIALDRSRCFRITAPALLFAGFSLTGLGDMNGDGLADLALGSLPYQGGYGDQVTYVILGRASGIADISLTTMREGIDGFTVTGAGFLVASPGDVNGDGLADLLAVQFAAWQDQGNSFVVVMPRGASSFPTPSPSLQPSSLPSARPSSLPTGVQLFPTAAPRPPSAANQTAAPTIPRTPRPSRSPSRSPTARPTARPTPLPSAVPTVLHTDLPETAAPTRRPSRVPSVRPSRTPSATPSLRPSSASTRNRTYVHIETPGDYSLPPDDGQVFISSTGLVRIGSAVPVGGAGRRVYHFLPAGPHNFSLYLLLAFDASQDQLDVSAFPALQSLASISFATSPSLTLVLSPSQSIVLPAHRSGFDLGAANFIFAPALEQTKASSGLSQSSAGGLLSSGDPSLLVALAFLAVAALGVSAFLFAIPLPEDSHSFNQDGLDKENQHANGAADSSWSASLSSEEEEEEEADQSEQSSQLHSVSEASQPSSADDDLSHHHLSLSSEDFLVPVPALSRAHREDVDDGDDEDQRSLSLPSEYGSDISYDPYPWNATEHDRSDLDQDELSEFPSRPTSRRFSSRLSDFSQFSMLPADSFAPSARSTLYSVTDEDNRHSSKD